MFFLFTNRSQNLNSNDLVRQKTITTIVQEGANGPDLTMIPRLSGSPTKPAPNSKSQGGSQTGESTFISLSYFHILFYFLL